MEEVKFIIIRHRNDLKGREGKGREGKGRELREGWLVPP